MRHVREFRVFVASPGDTKEERQHVVKIIEQLNQSLADDYDVRLQPIMWETHAWPGFGEEAQDVINQQVGTYDIFVGIMWNRLGTPTKKESSGTVEEFKRAYNAWHKNKTPVLMFYFNRAPSDLNNLDALSQKQAVVEFKQYQKQLGAVFVKGVVRCRIRPRL